MSGTLLMYDGAIEEIEAGEISQITRIASEARVLAEHMMVSESEDLTRFVPPEDVTMLAPPDELVIDVDEDAVSIVDEEEARPSVSALIVDTLARADTVFVRRSERLTLVAEAEARSVASLSTVPPPVPAVRDRDDAPVVARKSRAGLALSIFGMTIVLAGSIVAGLYWLSV